MNLRLQPGQRVGRWRLETPLGKGAFGLTWRAVSDDGLVAALKILSAPPGDELRALARVCHPGVVAVLDGGGEPVPFVVMELARGRMLPTNRRGRAAPLDAVVAVGAALADALAAVHHAGLTHGDVKPDNVIVGPAPELQVWLVDFGLAGAAAGGSLNYAAPERTAGERTSAEADVYALGLVLWEMLHGTLPWPELGKAEALLRRRSEVPSPSAGPPWLRELLVGALAVDPARRPRASEIADTFAANGAVLPQPDAALLARRARSVHLTRPKVAESLGRWLKDGGLVALVGPTGSGRTHTLDGLVTELSARGVPWVRMVPTEHPWSPVEQVLADPRLVRPRVALPATLDPLDRAEEAARLLEERSPSGLWVLVDDTDALDVGSALVLEALARHGRVSLCGAAATAPRWAEETVPLEPMDAAGIEQLISAILGASGPLAGLVARTLSMSGGVPGPAVAFLLAAVREGAVVRRAYTWLVDDARMDQVAAGPQTEVPLEGSLPEDAQKLGAILAIQDLPAPITRLGPLAGLDAPRAGVALEILVEKGLARAEAGQARVTSRASSATLLRAAGDVVWAHRAMVTALAADPGANAARLGWHVVGARDSSLAEKVGVDAIPAARRQDSAEAARLADALWALAPVPALAGPRIDALVSAGRAAEARAFGERFLDERPLGPEVVPVLIALGRVHVSFTRDDDAAMTCVGRAYQALAGAPPPWELLDLEALAHFQARRVEDAIRVARPVADQAPPADPSRLDRWLTLRGIWAQALERGGDLRAAIAVLDAVPEDLGRGRPARALLDAMLGRLQWHAGKIREASRLMARASAEGAGLPALDRARNLNNAALCSYEAGDLGGAVASWEQALLLFERLGSTLEEVRAQVNLSVGYREAGRWERARQSGSWALERAAALGYPDLEAMAVGNLGDLHLARKSFDEAERAFTRAAALAETHGLEPIKVELARRRAELALLRGDAEALELARTAERAAARGRDEIERSRSEALIAVGLARAGKSEAVLESLNRAMEPLKRAGAARALAEIRIWAAEAHLALGHTDEALAEGARVKVYAEEGGHALLRLRADDVTARARAGLGTRAGSERLGHLLELAVAVAAERDLRSLLDRIAGSALDLLQADRAFLILDRGGQGADDDLVVAAQRIRPDVPPGPLSMSVVTRAMRGRREVIAPDVVERGDLRSAHSVRAMHLRSVMCVPLVDGAVTLGAIYVDSLTASEQELSEAARFLRGLAAFAAVAVTNARRLQEADERAERAAEVAHDLSKPVAILLSVAADLSTRPGLTPELREGLEDIAVSGERALTLARSLLAERPRPHRPVNLARVALRHIDELSREARRAGVALRLEGPDKLWVRGDAEDLGRALTNLVSNALKFSPTGTEVLVTLEADAHAAICRVRDHGRGIPPESLVAIFGRGVQGSNAPQGYGLGLAIARRIIADDHGGEITAENAADGGALFTFRLPLLEGARPEG